MATGPFSEDDLGVSCYHSKTGAVELYLNHLVDGPGEYVVVDCTAGADSFASGLFTRFDLTFLVAEPTRKGVGVYRQWSEYAAGYDVALAVVGNKVQHAAGRGLPARARSAATCWPASAMNPRSGPWSRAAGSAWPTSSRGPARRCGTLQDAVDAQVKDWATFTRQAVEFHLRNARAWANAATGEDLAAQVDPGFALSSAVLRGWPRVTRPAAKAAEPLAQHGQDLRAEAGDVFPGQGGISGAFHHAQKVADTGALDRGRHGGNAVGGRADWVDLAQQVGIALRIAGRTRSAVHGTVSRQPRAKPARQFAAQQPLCLLAGVRDVGYHGADVPGGRLAWRSGRGVGGDHFPLPVIVSMQAQQHRQAAGGGQRRRRP